MTPLQRYWWRVALELKLRRSSGNAFQDFLSTLMAKRYGEDFVRVRPFGALGDKGCDGYLQSTGEVFQCYGALNGDGGKVDYLIGKMGDDYDKAKKDLPSVMKAWTMAHNLVDGLPIHAVLQLDAMRKADPSREFSFMGLERFEAILFELDPHDIGDLLGIAANSDDSHDLQVTELRELIAALVQASDEIVPAAVPIRPVPVDKLELNNLPGHWRKLIEMGWQNAHLVGEYLSRHGDPLTGETIAEIFRVRYQYLKSQNLGPGAIMSSLFEMVTGPGTVQPVRQVAAHALLAYLFESCDIFEDHVAKVSA